MLVILAILEVPLSLIRYSDTEAGAEPTIIFLCIRVLKLGRVARILRIARLHIFKDLTKMVSGAVGGMRTLFWSIVLIIVPLYMLAVILTESLADKAALGHGAEAFSTLPMSLFTLFRCLVVAECSTSNGRPLFSLVTEAYGWQYGFLYCLSIVLMMFGLFNVITAIYVDNTLTAAKYVEQKQKRMRLLDNQAVGEKLVELLEFIRKYAVERDESLTKMEAYEIEITPEVYDEMRQLDEFQSILHALDIADEDQVDIFETLDVDGSGTVDLGELIVGIAKMRGDARRSDVVGIILIVRSIQTQLNKLSEDICNLRHTVVPSSL